MLPVEIMRGGSLFTRRDVDVVVWGGAGCFEGGIIPKNGYQGWGGTTHETFLQMITAECSFT